jgi:hypothetical protein
MGGVELAVPVKMNININKQKIIWLDKMDFLARLAAFIATSL